MQNGYKIDARKSHAKSMENYAKMDPKWKPKSPEKLRIYEKCIKNNNRKKHMIFGLLKTLQTKPPFWARARFSGFGPLQKKLNFGIVLNLDFGKFVSFMRRKQGFYGCLKTS